MANRSLFRRLADDERDDVLVVGLGRFGSALASTLEEMGHRVLGVDVDAGRVQRHADVLTHVVQGDASDGEVLRQLGVADMPIAAVCIGSDIESSVLTAVALVDAGVATIWAKAITEPHGRILSRVGAHHVVFPEADMGRRVAHLLSERLLEYVTLDGEFVLAELPVPLDLNGVVLGASEMRARHEVTVVCVKPLGGEFTYATADTVLGAGDLMVVAGRRERVDAFITRS